ncbi:adenylyl-sulfate kinase [Paenibacillus xylanexedens]|uniref:adenylyl-sulfate kinase n=1 Tax=Paenibacillus xylanexedens TaxID=528191 RepID=UPI001F230330|nr:adenylyl-sulfate kinase [Paenibacillus xylanexedens]
MMTRRLILIEGLPGSGKSTVAKMVSEILIEQGKKVQLFQEGNLDHPADYEGVSFYYAGDFEALLKTQEEYREILESNATAHDQGFLIPYRKMKEQGGIELPEHIVQDIFRRDIYEIPFEENVKLITEKWQDFTQNVLSTNDDSITIFDCCFIQNPLTMGLVKCNQPKEQNVQYVLELGRIIDALNPLLIYIDQKDISYTFDNAVSERPKEWSEGFINYYTNQGLGQAQSYQDVKGTVRVLQERKKLESEIYGLLQMDKVWLDNSDYDREVCRHKLEKILQ